MIANALYLAKLLIGRVKNARERAKTFDQSMAELVGILLRDGVEEKTIIAGSI